MSHKLHGIIYNVFKGPKTWLDVYEDCAGNLQSPINLGVNNASVYSDEATEINFSDGYKDILAGKLFNNGHTGEMVIVNIY